MKQTLQTATLDNGIILLGEFLPGVESVSVSFHVAAGSVCDSFATDETGRSCCGLATLAGEPPARPQQLGVAGSESGAP